MSLLSLLLLLLWIMNVGLPKFCVEDKKKYEGEFLLPMSHACKSNFSNYLPILNACRLRTRCRTNKTHKKCSCRENNKSYIRGGNLFSLVASPNYVINCVYRILFSGAPLLICVSIEDCEKNEQIFKTISIMYSCTHCWFE